MGMRGHQANKHVVRYRARRKLDHVVPRDLIAKAPVATKPEPVGAATPPSSSAPPVASDATKPTTPKPIASTPAK